MRCIICLLALAALVACPGCKKPKSKAEQLYEKAVEQKELQRYDEAKRFFRLATEADPAFDKPYFELGEINDIVLGNYTEAVAWYEKFLGVTQNSEMKERVANNVKDLRNAIRSSSTGAAGESLAGPAKETLDKALSAERAKLEREFNVRQKALVAQKDGEFEKIKEDLRKLKSDNLDYENKVQELRIERDAAVKKATSSRSHEEIAKLLTSSSFTGSDKERELGQKLIEMQTAADKMRADLGTEQGKTRQIEAQLVRLRQQAAETGRATPTDSAADKRVADLRDENKRLTEQVALLKRSADDAASVVASRADTASQDTITRLKADLAAAEKEKKSLAADKKSAEDEATTMKQRAEELAAAASSSSSPAASTTEENRKLRLQIEKITGQYNDLSAKLASSEQHAKSIEEDLDKLRSLQPATKAAVDGGFTDLSDEIKKMQDVIDAQKRFIVKRDTEINSLTEQMSRLQNQKGDSQPAATNLQLVDELNNQLQAREERIAQLNRELEQARSDSASADALTTPPASVLPGSTPAVRAATAPLPGSSPAVRTVPAVTPAPSLPGSSPTVRTAPTTPSVGTTLPRGTRTYRVQPNDTLGKIAEKAYGDKTKWMQIFNYNRKLLPTASALRVGMNLYIPPLQP